MAMEFIKEVTYHGDIISIQSLIYIECRYIRKLMLDSRFYKIITYSLDGDFNDDYVELIYSHDLKHDGLEYFLEQNSNFVYATLLRHHSSNNNHCDEDVIAFIHALFKYIELQKLFPLNGKPEL